MALDPQLLDILACPEDKGPLYYLEPEGVLYNPRLRRSYAVRDGIPVMLIDEATTLDDETVTAYDAIVRERQVPPTFRGDG